jgi:DNA-directed RNA polymerase subunit RPC12/RpoP
MLGGGEEQVKRGNPCLRSGLVVSRIESNMMDVITCSQCQRQLQLPTQYLGEMVQCPQCQHRFVASRSTVVVKEPPASRFDEHDDDVDIGKWKRQSRTDYQPHRGSMMLALGLISIVGGMMFCLPLVVGPIAWFMATRDLRAIRDGWMDPAGESMTRSGQLCGLAASIFLFIAAAFISATILNDLSRGR